MPSLTPEKILELEEAAYQIRRLSIEMITYAQLGASGRFALNGRHPGSSLFPRDEYRSA